MNIQSIIEKEVEKFEKEFTLTEAEKREGWRLSEDAIKDFLRNSLTQSITEALEAVKVEKRTLYLDPKQSLKLEHFQEMRSHFQNEGFNQCVQQINNNIKELLHESN